ncbi:MAG: hypothetical protein ACRDNZ_15230 [Streptosporangiaceae bacterium]
MTAPPVLGDFLTAARKSLDSAASRDRGRAAAPGRELEEVTGSLRSFITVAGRYAGDIVAAFGEMPSHVRRQRRIWPVAAAETLAALSAASLTLAPDGSRATPPGQPKVTCAQARRLDAATASLTVGRDLLQTHLIASRGGWAHRSDWAAVIASPAVSAALLAEVASLTVSAAAAVTGMPAISDRGATASEQVRRVSLACQWLARAQKISADAQDRKPVPDAYRELARAIPATAVPARHCPAAGAGVAELCEAIITTSERARRAAWLAGQVPSESPSISVTSWRRIAASGAAASRHCQILLQSLAEQAGQVGDGATSYRLQVAAAGISPACRTWELAARQLGEVTTDVLSRPSRAAGEANDLALLTGRLAYADPGWNLSARTGSRPRPGADLAPAPSDIPGVVAAVHHAADSLAGLAHASERQARAAVTASRVSVPARASGTAPAAAPFTRPSGQQTLTFLLACQETRTAAARTASSIGQIAIAVQAPSRVLAAARAAAGTEPGARPVLEEAQSRAAAPAEAEADTARPGEPQAGTGGDQRQPGLFEARLREIGVTSGRYLGRAASIDRNGEEIIKEAAAEILHHRYQPPNLARTAGRAGPSAHKAIPRTAPRLSPRVSPQAELEAEP